MVVLVTGGAGYLGCPLVTELARRGHEVRVYDRLCFGDAPGEYVAGLPNCTLIRGDVRRLQEHPGLLDGVEAVVHLAALSNDPSCALNEDMAEDVNVESTRELANQALQRGVRRFVQASTCSVYGQAAFEQLDEQSPTNPVSPYGATSLRAEQAVLGLRNDSFEPVVARLATLFGWSERMRFDLAVNQMVATAARLGVVNILGGGNQWRPFLHVADAAAGLAQLLEAPGDDVSGEVFNVGADALNYRIADLAREIAGQFDDVRLEVARDDDDLRTFNVLFEKLHGRFGFRPSRRLADGVAELRERLADPAVDPNADACFNVRTMKRLLATPVSEGGEPVAPRFVPLYRPSLGPEEEAAVVQTLRSGWLTSAARVPAFEKLFAQTVGAAHSVAVTSCTAALHLCLVDAGVGPGDEVITTPLTWASTANTLAHMGARPVFVDVLPGTLNMDPAALEAAVTERTRVIMPVHLAGQPCDLDAIRAVASPRGIRVVEDAAHALGGAYKGAPIGSSDFTCFSFYAIKNITTVDGGAITVNSGEVAERLGRLAHHGLGQTAWDRYGRSSDARPDEVVVPGFKYKLTDVGAAMGIAQLRKFPGFKAARERLARMYRTALGDIDEVALPHVRDDVVHAWHLFIVRLRLDRLAVSRDEVREELRRENIGTGLHFYGLHLHQYYRETLGIAPESLPNATAASRDMMSLPLFPLMEDKHIQQVADALKKVLARARKPG